MNFHHFVKRYTRVVFIFIVIVMIVPLVLWGYMGPSGSDGDDTDAGIIFKSIPVKRSQYDEHLARAVGTFYWRKILSGARRIDDVAPKSEDLVRLAWEHIVLLQDARDHGVLGTEGDYQEMISKIFLRLTGGQVLYEDRHFVAMAGIFKLHPQRFEEWLRDRSVIEKHLDMVSEATFADYERVYEGVMTQDQLVKVSYVSFDPKDYERELKPVRPDEVAKYFESNKQRFKVPEKIQVSYLMAEVDAFKKTVPEPTEAEVSKHYEDTRAQYLIPAEHKHEPGQPHRDDEPVPPPQYKPLSEVREQVVDSKKLAVAREQVRKIMEQVDIEIGASKKDGKYPENILETLREKVQRDQRIELTHDITAAFDEAHVDEVEKSVGKDSRLASWGFDKARAVGDVSEKVVTDKGAVIFRLQVKKDAYESDLNEQIRGRITKILELQQLRTRASQQANNLVQEIGTRGIAAARLRHGGDWKSSRYFKAGGDTGIENQGISSQVSRQVQGGSLKLGAASVVASPPWDPEKKDFSHVVYFEDRVSAPPENIDGAFKQGRENLNRDVRNRARDSYVANRVREAALQDFVNKAEEKKLPPPPAPAPKITLPVPAPGR